MNKKKLLDKTILNTRPLTKALPLAKAIEAEGGRCIVLPSIEIIPVSIPNENKLLTQVEESDFLLFVSQYAVQYTPRICFSSLVKKVAIGRATAKALEQIGISTDLIPEEPSSEGLLSLPIFESLEGKSVTIFRGKSGRTLLDETLQQRGAIVQEVILYERVLPVWTPEDYALISQNTIDVALGLSVDSLTYFFSQLKLSEKKRLLSVPWLVMSDRVAEQAKKLGIETIHIVSKGDVLRSLIQCCSFGTI